MFSRESVPRMGIAILLPLTAVLPPTPAIIMLAATLTGHLVSSAAPAVAHRFPVRAPPSRVPAGVV